MILDIFDCFRFSLFHNRAQSLYNEGIHWIGKDVGEHAKEAFIVWALYLVLIFLWRKKVLRIVIKMVIPTPSHIRYFIIITPTLVRNIIPVMDITNYPLRFSFCFKNAYKCWYIITYGYVNVGRKFAMVCSIIGRNSVVRIVLFFVFRAI